MFIYNTLTRTKEEFQPLNPPKVTMYVCGPTIYNYFHIGNARSFIMADIIRKYLQYKKYEVKFVMNLTDIDDKLIKKANEENLPFEEIAQKYEKAFFEDISKLGIEKANVHPKATEHIEDIIKLISTLEEKNYAYNIDGNVFYNVSKFENYGKLSGKNLSDLESGARVEIDLNKKNPLDFALWKRAKDNEPFWESPWGKGRPGWHIECSAMSMKHLGKSIDIHAGGSDLIFPHHENEIAQSEASCGSKFVKYWIHFGFLNMNQEKMSKSLGNFFTARDILNKYSANSIRLFFSQSHYSGPINFNEESLEAAEKGLEKIYNLLDKLYRIEPSTESPTEFEIEKYLFAFESAMDDNFNTPQALSSIFDFVRDFNKFISKNGKLSLTTIEKSKEFLNSTLQNVFGIKIYNPKSITKSTEVELINLLIDLRKEAKLDKNFTLADKIRKKLSEIGIVLEDTKEGTQYKLVSK